MRKILLALLVVNLLMTTIYAQDWKPLLGENHEQSIKRTSKYGIAYQSNGFDEAKKKIIKKKTPKFLTQRGAEHLIEGFQIVATTMTENEQSIPAWIDDAWEEIKGLWLGCGGKYAQAAQSFNPRSLSVVVEQQPFWIPQWGVFVNGTTDGRNIKAVNITTAGLFSDPKNANLVFFSDLMRWEIGNSLQLHAGLWNKTVEGEFGHRSPCGQGIMTAMENPAIVRQ